MKIGIVACGAIVREMIAVANRQKWDYELTAVPAQYHNTPTKIAPAVEKHLDEWADRFDLILIGHTSRALLVHTVTNSMVAKALTNSPMPILAPSSSPTF